MGTVIISIAVVAVLVLAIVYLVRQKKSGTPMCGGQCSNCPSGALCASQRKTKNGEL